ncbi:MAG: CRTAC1 family protein [Thermodesulfobacteriota bacterium]
MTTNKLFINCNRSLSFVFMLTVLSFALIGGCGGSGNNSGDNGDNNGGNNNSLTFTDITLQAGLNYSHGFVTSGPVSEPQLISGGVAAGDYDNDGWVDIYVVRGPAGPNLLFKNNGNGTFSEVGQAAGVDVDNEIGSGPTFADFSGDGYLDLFIGGIFPTKPRLFLNDGDGTFTDISAGKALTSLSSINTFSAAFGDYDLDNDLDLLITHWNGQSQNESTEHLWRNNGDNTFSDVSLEAGISATYDTVSEFTFTPNFADINNNGYPDILMGSDFLTSQIFINQKDGTFVNTTDTNVITDENGMGASVGDYDNDGDLDWFVSSIYDPNMIAELNWGISGNRLYRNKGDGTFEDVTLSAGVEHGFWGWASCMYDLDNDGNMDIVHVNGFRSPFDPDTTVEFDQDPSRIFMSNGNGTFTEKAAQLGFNDTDQGRGIVCFDFDRDGDVDIFVANNNQPPSLYRNDGGNENSFLKISLNGISMNTEGIGARVEVTTGNTVQMRELSAGSNFVSQNPVIAHFGLAQRQIADEVKVSWPDGNTTTLQNVPVNQFMTIDHPDL